MLQSFVPGQAVRCTLTRAPRSAAARATLQRLMQMSPTVARGLRKAQRQRRQNMVVYNRGNRDWYQRRRCGKQVRVVPGQAWTIPFSFQILPDLRSIEKYLSLQPA